MKMILFITIIVFSSCSSIPHEKDTRLISVLQQYTVYSGEAQPVKIHTGQAALLSIVYYTSQEDIALDSGGTTEAPVNAGLYYVRIVFPSTKSKPDGDEIIVEYLIDRAPVNITADDFQFAMYNGSPRRVTAETDTPVKLSFSYFSTREALLAAAVLETTSEERGTALQGYKRVESSPREPGIYYVMAYYKGDNNYLPSGKEIVFEIRSKN